MLWDEIWPQSYLILTLLATRGAGKCGYEVRSMKDEVGSGGFGAKEKER